MSMWKRGERNSLNAIIGAITERLDVTSKGTDLEGRGGLLVGGCSEVDAIDAQYLVAPT